MSSVSRAVALFWLALVLLIPLCLPAAEEEASDAEAKEARLAKIRALVQTFRPTAVQSDQKAEAKKQNELRPSPGGRPPDSQSILAKMQELNQERNGRATEVLGKEQQEKYAKLKGKPFDVAQLTQFRRGMGRGGPGGSSADHPLKKAEKAE